MRALGLLWALTAALTFPIDQRAVEAALSIANSAVEADHRQFHADYHVPVNSPPVDFISIVTPFRRVVLRAETEARLGRRRIGQREAFEALRVLPDRVEIYVELTFHPHSTFVGIPDYAVVVEPSTTRTPRLAATDIVRIPRFGTRLDTPWHPYAYPFDAAPQLPSKTQSITGGTLIGTVPVNQLELEGRTTIAVVDGARTLARAQVDLSRMR